jgi:hypothetical protein
MSPHGIYNVVFIVFFFGKYWVDGAGEDAKTPLAKEKQKQKLTGIRNKNNKKR